MQTELTIGGETVATPTSIAWKLVIHYIRPLEPFFNDPSITSIAVNRYDTIFVRRHGTWEKTDARFDSEDQLVNAITQVVFALGQEIHADKAPVADGRLHDGSRVNAVLYPTAHRGSNMTIRLFPKVRYSLDDLLAKGVMNEEMRDYLGLSVKCEDNTAVSGATGSGKTTILNALANLAPDEYRTGVIEDTAELNISKPNILFMEAPKRSIKDKHDRQVVTMESLLVNTLRQELQSVVVGEIREPSAATALMLALNTGHRGVKSTGHANSTEKFMRRVINMLLSTDTRIPYEAVRAEIYDNFNLIIQAEHTPKHGKRIVQIDEVVDDQLKPLYRWDYLAGEHKRVYQHTPRLFALAEQYGFDLPSSIKNK